MSLQQITQKKTLLEHGKIIVVTVLKSNVVQNTNLTHSTGKLLLDSLFPAASALLEFTHVVPVTNTFFLLGIHTASFKGGSRLTNSGISNEGGGCNECLFHKSKVVTKINEKCKLYVRDSQL